MSYHSKEPYPKDKLLSKSNVEVWDDHIQMKMMDYPDLGLAILNKKKYTIERPHRDDKFPHTNLRKYVQDVLEPTQLEPASMERYARDMDRHADALVALKKTEAEFCSLIRSSFSQEAQILLRSDPRYSAASNSISSYDLYFVCRELHSSSSSFSVAQNTMVSIFSSPWPGSLNQLKDNLLHQRIKVSAMFDKNRTGTIQIDDLFLVALLNALPDDLFSYPKDKIYAENVTGDIPNFLNTLETMTNFDNYKSIASTSIASTDPSSPTPAGPTALAAVSTSTSICKVCLKPFPSVISKISKAPFQLCYTCNKKRLAEADGKSIPTIPTRPPTEEQIQQAHAVLRAAHSNTPVPPALDAAYLNYFVQKEAAQDSPYLRPFDL